MVAEIDEFLVYDEMLWVMGQTGRRQVDCNKLLKKFQNTVTVDIATKHNHTTTVFLQSHNILPKKIITPLNA